MLIAALFVLLFSSGHGIDGLVHDFSARIGACIPDRTLAKQVTACNREMLEAEASFNEHAARARASLIELNRRRDVTTQELEAAFVSLDAERAKARDAAVAARFRMKALMTAEQWNCVHAAPAASK